MIAEFLYECVQETIEQDLPSEVKYLEAYDRFTGRVQALVDVPSQTLDLLWRFLQQNHGKLSKRARTNEFAALSDEEAVQIEKIFRESFLDRPLA